MKVSFFLLLHAISRHIASIAGMLNLNITFCIRDSVCITRIAKMLFFNDFYAFLADNIDDNYLVLAKYFSSLCYR